MMQRKGIIYILLGLVAFLWFVPWVSGFFTSLYIDKYFNPIQVHDLTLGLSRVKAKNVSISYGTKLIEINHVDASIRPWNWLVNGVHIDELTADKVIVKDSKQQVQKSIHKHGKSNFFFIPVKHLLLRDVVFGDHSIGKIESTWKKTSLRTQQLTVVFHDQRQARLDAAISGLFTYDIQYKLNLFDHKLSGKMLTSDQGLIWYSDEFKQVYPKGILISKKENFWRLTDVSDPKDELGRIGLDQGFVNLVDANVDIAFSYLQGLWKLKVKSRHFEVDLKADNFLEGLIKFNQYPLLDKLVTGLVVIKKDSQAFSMNSQLQVFNYQSKDKLNFSVSKTSSGLLANLKYFYENNDVIKIDLKSIDEFNMLVTQTGIMNQKKFSAKQKIKRLSDVYEIEWLPIKFGNGTWLNNHKTHFSFQNASFIIKPECFVNNEQERICVTLDFRNQSIKNNLSIQYKTQKKRDLSEWLPNEFIVSDLFFKGEIDINYSISNKYPTLHINARDISFRFDPLVSTEIPMSSRTVITSGEGKIDFDAGEWTYLLHLNANHDGHITLNSKADNNVEWKNLLSGYKEDSYLISDGKGVWDQNKYTCHLDIAFQSGQINLVDYYNKVSNPVKVNRFNLPIIFSFQLTNQQPIGINILGIEGFFDVDLRIDEKESIWIANGDVSMLSGGIFRKNVEPVTIREARILYYNNDISDPFIQMSLEKRQTLLTRSNQVSNYQDELLGVRIYGKLQNYQLQTYSTPAGINEFVILQTVLINPILYSEQGSKGNKDLVSSLASSVRELRNLLPFDQITFRPAERKQTLVDPYEESSTVSMMKKMSQSLGLYARIGSLPQDNIFSLIYRKPNRMFGTQLYSNYESQGFNIVYSH